MAPAFAAPIPDRILPRPSQFSVKSAFFTGDQPWLRKSGCYVDSGHRSALGRVNDDPNMLTKYCAKTLAGNNGVRIEEPRKKETTTIAASPDRIQSPQAKRRDLPTFLRATTPPSEERKIRP
jgi:hypothetical protein